MQRLEIDLLWHRRTLACVPHADRRPGQVLRRQGGPEEILTYDLTLTDGTIIHNARPGGSISGPDCTRWMSPVLIRTVPELVRWR